MCGICGFISFQNKEFLNKYVLEKMTHSIFHRGPDEGGSYVDDYAILGIRRLSIIDIQTGQQPICNEDGTIWIVYNGEFYNYREIRHRLEKLGHKFKTKSDTEVILHAYEEYGERCFQYINGMFAFAIWDANKRRLLLGRDRLGIKPLFYWVGNGQIIFGSELKAILSHPGVERVVDEFSLDQFLTLEYIPSPRTIFRGISKLEPGHYLVFEHNKLKIQEYWDIQFQPFNRSKAQVIEELLALLNDAVQLRLVSDVPVGALLSGGIDSSTIVALMSKYASHDLNTYSIGFVDDSYNEIEYARSISQKFNTKHQERILESNITDLVPKLVGQFDEPFGDFSIFPTYLVSKLARQSVKVVLTGDGGDEIFGGYDAYVAQNVERYYRYLPRYLRIKAIPNLLDRVPPQKAKKGFVNKLKRFVEGGSLPPSLQHARWMMFVNELEKATLYSPAMKTALHGSSFFSVFEPHFRKVSNQAPLIQQQYVDVKTYLADDILTKVDRMSMAASLEARVPLLDHRVVELAINLPTNLKMDLWQTKKILREAMKDVLPRDILNKPKQGFSIPIKHWLRDSLKTLMLDLLSENTIRRRGYFNAQAVDVWVQEHLENKANHSHRLWALLVFELWHQQMIDNNPNAQLASTFN